MILFAKLRCTFAFRLIIALAVANIGLEITYLMGIHSVHSTAGCLAKGWMRLYFTLAGLFITTVIMAMCYRLIIKNDRTIQESYWKMMAICWGIPIVMTLLHLISSTFDNVNSDAWCGISGLETSGEYESELWGLFLLYVPLWITVIANFWMLFNVSEAILHLENIAYKMDGVTPPGGNKLPSSTSYGALEDSSTCSPVEPGPPARKSRTVGVINILRMYPVALCVCYSWATVNRIFELITDSQSPFWLYVLQVCLQLYIYVLCLCHCLLDESIYLSTEHIMSISFQYSFMALNGAANALIFLLMPPVLEEWVALYKKNRHLLFPWKRRDGKTP